jgi:S-adenosylmethionine synthetase
MLVLGMARACCRTPLGQPIDKPALAAVQVILEPGVALAEVAPALEAAMAQEPATIDHFTGRLAHGELPVA